MRTAAGVHPQKDGSVLIAPHTMDLNDLRGQAATKNGPVVFAYIRNENNKWEYALTLPAGTSGLFRFPGGKETPLHEGEQLLKEE